MRLFEIYFMDFISWLQGHEALERDDEVMLNPIYFTILENENEVSIARSDTQGKLVLSFVFPVN